MGRSRGSRSGRCSGVASGCATFPLMKVAVDGSVAECAAASRVKPSSLVHAVEGASDATPSTASPSHAGTAASTPTSHGAMPVLCGESASNVAGVAATLDEGREADKMLNDPVAALRDSGPTLLQLAAFAPQPSLFAAQGPEPWAVARDDSNPAKCVSNYHETLRSNGRAAMHASELWRPIALAEQAALSRTYGKADEKLPAAQALGLMLTGTEIPTWPVPPVAHSQFRATANYVVQNGQGFVPAEMLQMPLTTLSESQMPPMRPKMLPTAGGVCSSMQQLLAIAMPGSLSGLSNSQIEEQLRAAASTIVTYHD